jgi:hypothetical protein
MKNLETLENIYSTKTAVLYMAIAPFVKVVVT